MHLTVTFNATSSIKNNSKNGYRKFNYNIPEEYVNLGAKPKKVYDIGILNIQLQFPGEKHDKNFVIRDTKA
uniref:Hsp20/alpha crystallin family protein n=1 Tax=Heterorhabditis bacteriophora TaxID=37862 RepID=A0A1I7X688_HETBA